MDQIDGRQREDVERLNIYRMQMPGPRLKGNENGWMGERGGDVGTAHGITDGRTGGRTDRPGGGGGMIYAELRVSEYVSARRLGSEGSE